MGVPQGHGWPQYALLRAAHYSAAQPEMAQNTCHLAEKALRDAAVPGVAMNQTMPIDIVGSFFWEQSLSQKSNIFLALSASAPRT